MMGFIKEITKRIEDRLPFVDFDPPYFMWPVRNENVGSRIYRLVRKVTEPSALLVSVDRHNSEIGTS